MTQTLIRIKTLTQVKQLPGEVIDLAMTSEDRQRVHRRLTAPDGQTFALELPTGTILPVGGILYLTKSRAYRVTAAAEDVLTIKPRSLAEAALAGHLIGNLHRDIDLVEDEVIALCTAPLEHKLTKAGLPYIREKRPFKGAPAGEHSH